MLRLLGRCRAVRSAAAGLAALCIVTACSDGSADVKSSTSVSPSASPTDSAAVAGREALAAYRGMWDAFVEAGKTSDASSPELSKYATDHALAAIVSALEDNKKNQVVLKGELKTSPQVVSVQPEGIPNRVDILDCADTSNWLEYRVSGGLADDEPGGRRKVTAAVQNLGGWKVTSFAAQGIGTC